MDIRKSSHSVVFECDDEIYSYASKGTFFWGKYLGKYYAISLNHVILGGGTNPEKIMLHCCDNSSYFAGIDSYWAANNSRDCDEAHDLLVITPSQDTPLCWENDFSYIDLDTLGSIENIDAGQRLYVFGFPAELNYVNYSDLIIGKQRIQISGIFEKSFDNCLMKMKLSSVKDGEMLFQGGARVPLGGLDGMSGSPVMAYVNSISEQMTFAGVLCRGSIDFKVSNFAYFIHAQWVIKALKEMTCNNLQTKTETL